MSKSKYLSNSSVGLVDGFSFIDYKEPKIKKEKRPIVQNIDGDYDLEQMKRDADNLEKYIDIISRYAILKNVSKKESDDAIKTIRKAIKYLREGRGDKVYDRERYLEYMNRG